MGSEMCIRDRLMPTNHIGDLPMGFGRTGAGLVLILALFSILERLERLALLENIIGEVLLERDFG